MNLEKAAKISVPKNLVAPLILTALNIVALAGITTWSIAIADEQAELRRDYLELSNAQDQLNIQFEYWLAKSRAKTEGGE